MLLGVLLGGVYGGYFGAAQGIMVLAILSLSLDDELQRLNAVKVILTGLVNLVSGIVFIFAAHVAWGAAGLIAGGSLLGGVIGARAGRRLSRRRCGPYRGRRDHRHRAAAGLTCVDQRRSARLFCVTAGQAATPRPPPPTSVLVGAHQARLLDDVVLDAIQQGAPVKAGLQVDVWSSA